MLCLPIQPQFVTEQAGEMKSEVEMKTFSVRQLSGSPDLFTVSYQDSQ